MKSQSEYVLLAYCPPTQTNYEFGSLLSGCEQIVADMYMNSLLFKLNLGDFSFISTLWWDGNIYNKEGIKLELTSMNNSLRECF